MTTALCSGRLKLFRPSCFRRRSSPYGAFGCEVNAISVEDPANKAWLPLD